MNNEKINALGGKVTLGGDLVPAENSIGQCRRIIINGVPRLVKVLVTDEQSKRDLDQFVPRKFRS